MKAYRFRLAGVARVRTVQERLEREHVGAAQWAVEAARATEDTCVERLRDAPMPMGAMDHAQFTATRSHGARCARDLEAARAQHDHAQGLLAQRIEAWLGARQRVGVLERLDEHARNEWKVAAGREDAAILDDLGITRWNARQQPQRQSVAAEDHAVTLPVDRATRPDVVARTQAGDVS